MNNLDKQYQALLQDILDNGVEKNTRNGKVLSVFGRQIRHNMKDGFPLLTTKKMFWKGIVTELLWFLKGDTNIKYLVDNDTSIWNGDAYKNYLKNFVPPVCPPNLDVQPSFYEPMSKEMFIKSIQEKNSRGDEFAKKWGELGPVYGKQWRSWKIGERKLKWSQLSEEQKLSISKETLESTHPDVAFFTEEKSIDQIQNLISELKTNPDSRRLMVSAWNVGELDQMVLPPCHFSWQCYSHEKDGKRYLSLAWNQRSCDVGIGIPFNIASYGLLLEIIARSVNMIPYELIGNLGDCHIYNNHIDGVKEQLTREPYPLPTLKINWGEPSIIEKPQYWKPEDFTLENYQSHPSIKLPLSN